MCGRTPPCSAGGGGYEKAVMQSQPDCSLVKTPQHSRVLSPSPGPLQGKGNRPEGCMEFGGFLFQTLLFTSRVWELPAVNWENAPGLARHPVLPPWPKFYTLRSCTSKHHSFHDYSASPSAETWLLVGAGEPPTKITTILPGGMSGNFPETPNQDSFCCNNQIHQP